MLPIAGESCQIPTEGDAMCVPEDILLTTLVLLNLVPDLQQPENWEICYAPWRCRVEFCVPFYIKKKMYIWEELSWSKWVILDLLRCKPELLSPLRVLCFFFIIQGTGYDWTGHNCCFKVFSRLQLTYFFWFPWFFESFWNWLSVFGWHLVFSKLRKSSEGFQKASTNEKHWTAF